MMWIKQVFLGVIGFASGSAVSAGVFSFIISIGVVGKAVLRQILLPMKMQLF